MRAPKSGLRHRAAVLAVLCAVLVAGYVWSPSASRLAPLSSASIASALASDSTVPSGSVAPSSTPATTTYVVVIDAGHQAKADLKTEPIGPGSKTRRARVEGGATGVSTHRPESLDNLQIALKLQSDLEKRGVKVIMVRTKQNVDIPNSKRAKIANDAHADLFIRLHCDSSSSSSVKGVLMLVPASNAWTRKIVKPSARAGRDVLAAVLKTTRAKNRGTTKRSDLSGFNWSKVPTALVEMGLMSNPAEDRALASAAYQSKLASGATAGIMTFLSGK